MARTVASALLRSRTLAPDPPPVQKLHLDGLSPIFF